MKDKYYVYEWIRLDNNEPFYIGKGCKNRCYKLTRNNNHFNNIVNSIPCAVNILHNNLDKQTAFGLEVWYIREYRDVIGYNLTNITDGGEGCTIFGKKHTTESKRKISESMKLIPRNEKWKKKISNTLKNKKHSKEHNLKVKINHADFNGKNNPKSKSVICLNTKRIFQTIKDASEFYNCNSSSLTACCKGKQKSCGKLENGEKLKWKYLIWKHNKKYRII